MRNRLHTSKIVGDLDYEESLEKIQNELKINQNKEIKKSGISNERVNQIVAGVYSRDINETVQLVRDSKLLIPSTFNHKDNKSPYLPNTEVEESTLKTLADNNFFLNFKEIASGKNQTASEFMQITLADLKLTNNRIANSTAKYQLSSINRINGAANFLKTALDNNKPFMTFDLETTGGRDQYGNQQLDDIIEFAFNKYHDKGNGYELDKAGTKRSVVGIVGDVNHQQYDALEREISGLRHIPESQWTERQRILVNTHYKYGLPDTKIIPMNAEESLWEVKNISEHNTNDVDKKLDYALEGLKLRKKIGEAQDAAASKNNGVYEYKKAYDEGLEMLTKGKIPFIGHNSYMFDANMINRNNPGTHYNLNNASHLDFLSGLRQIGSAYGKNTMFDDNIKQLADNLSKNQNLSHFSQEAITRYLFGEEGREHHSAYLDSDQLAQVFMNEEFRNKYFSLLNEINNSASSYTYDSKSKQIFAISNATKFEEGSALSFSFDPVSGQYRTGKGYSIDYKTGDVSKDLFGQTGSMKKRGLATFKVVDLNNSSDAVEQLKKISPEMATKNGYALIVTPYGKKPGQEGSVYLHTNIDSLLAQMSNAYHVATDLGNGKLRYEEGLNNADIAPHHLVNGKLTALGNSAEEKFNYLMEASRDKYVNDPAADLVRKLDFKKAGQINNLLKDQNYIKNLSDKVAKGETITIDDTLRNILGFTNRNTGEKEVYSETIKKTMNSLNFLSNQMPFINHIMNKVNEIIPDTGDKVVTARRNMAFKRAYNEMYNMVGEHGKKNAVLLGSSDIDYINIDPETKYGFINNTIQDRVVDNEFRKVYFSGGLLNDLSKNVLSNTPAGQGNGSKFAALSQFVDRLDQSDEYRGAIGFSDGEMKEFRKLGPEKFEAEILERLRRYTHLKRETNPEFGYLGETAKTFDMDSINKQFEIWNSAIKNGIESKSTSLNNFYTRIEDTISNTPQIQNITSNNPEDSKSSVDDLVNLMTSSFNEQEFREDIKDLGEKEKNVKLYNYQLQMDATRKFAEEIVSGNYTMGLGMAIQPNGTVMAFDQAYNYANIKLPRLKNMNGTIVADIDNTTNVLTPSLNMAEAISHNMDPSFIGFKSSFEDGMENSYKYSRYAHTAKKNGREGLDTLISWMQHTKTEIRKTSPSFDVFTSQVKASDNIVSVNDLVKALPSLQEYGYIDEMVSKGLLPKTFVSNMRQVLNPLGKPPKRVDELASAAKDTLMQSSSVILQYLSPKVSDPNVKAMLQDINPSLKDTHMAGGQLAAGYAYYTPGSAYNNPVRPNMNQMLNVQSYNKAEIEKRLKAYGLDGKVGFSFAHTTKEFEHATKTIDKATGYEMVSYAKVKTLLMDPNSFREMIVNEHDKDNNAFKEATNYLGDKTAAERLYQHAMRLNLSEQELLESTRLASSMHYKTQIQTIDVKKNMIIEHNNNLQTIEEIKKYNKLIPILDKDGHIQYVDKKNPENLLFVNKNDYLFTTKGYTSDTNWGAKYAGILDYGYFNPEGELVDQDTLTSLMGDNTFKHLGEAEDYLLREHNIRAKYYVLPQEMYSRPKITLNGLEKGVTDSLFVRTGEYDTELKTILKNNIHLTNLIGKVNSIGYLERLQTAGILDESTKNRIINEQNLLGDAIFKHMTALASNGILAVSNQDIGKHRSTTLIMSSDIERMKKAYDNADVKKKKEVEGHLKNAFNGTLNPDAFKGNNFLVQDKDISGTQLNMDAYNDAMKALGLKAKDEFEYNGAKGTIIHAYMGQNLQYEGGKNKDEAYIKDLKNRLETEKKYLEELRGNGASKKDLAEQANQIFKTQAEIDTNNHLQKGSIYSDRADFILNMRQWDDSFTRLNKHNYSQDEFEKYFGFAYDSDGKLKKEYTNRPLLEDWTNSVKDKMIKGNEEKFKEVAQGFQAMNFNSLNGRRKAEALAAMDKKGFEVLSFKDNLELASGKNYQEVLERQYNAYNKDIIVDFGDLFGDKQYLALSADTNPNKKEEHKVLLNSLATKYKQYEDADTMEGRQKIKDEMYKLVGKIEEQQQKDITGKSGKLQNIMKTRLDRSTEGSASIMAVIRGKGYDELNTAEKLTQLKKYNPESLSTATFQGKTLLEHYSEGKVINAAFAGEEVFENLGYFRRENMEKLLGGKNRNLSYEQLKEKTMEHLSKYGDIVATQRFPIIQESSIGPTAMFLDRTLASDQVKTMLHMSKGTNLDVDGDKLFIMAMMDKSNNTFANHTRDILNGNTKLRAENLSNAQTAFIMDRAASINAFYEDLSQKALEKSVDNANMSMADVTLGFRIGDKEYGGQKVFASLVGKTVYSEEEKYNHLGKASQYINEAKANLVKGGNWRDSGKGADAQALNDEVVRLIRKVQGSTQEGNDLITSFGVATKFIEEQTVRLSKPIKTSIGEANIVNKHIRDAFILTHDRSNKNFFKDISVLEAVVHEAEQATISNKNMAMDAGTSLNTTKAQELRYYSNSIFLGKNSGDNLENLRGWLKDNIETGKMVEKARTVASQSLEFAEDIKGLSDEAISNKMIDHFVGIMGSMANNSGLKTLSGYQKLAESLNGVKASDVLKIAIPENDNSIKGRALKEIQKVDSEIGRTISKGLFESNSAINTSNLHLVDGREWMENEGRQNLRKVIESSGEKFAEAMKGMSGRNLAIGALGIAGAYMMAGYVGGNPIHANKEAADESGNENNQGMLSLSDNSMNVQQGAVNGGYIININASTSKGKQHAIDAVRHAMSSSMPTDINLSMNITDKQGNISDRQFEKMMTGLIS